KPFLQLIVADADARRDEKPVHGPPAFAEIALASARSVCQIYPMRDVLEEIDIQSWTGPFDPAARSRAQEALERGMVLFFPRLAFALADSEKAFLSADVANGKSKNISLDPATGKVQGTALNGARAEALAAMIER